MADRQPHPDAVALGRALGATLGDKLRSVAIYGPGASGEATGPEELHVLVLLADLDLATLAAAGPAIERWVRGGHPFPRLFTVESLAEAVDVFPIEVSDIAERHVRVHGAAPLEGVPAIDRDNLRLQCERELREKLMRLEESYTLSSGRDRHLRQLLAASYPTFTAILRGCLRLAGKPAPHSELEAAESFCRMAEIDPAPFQAVARLRAGKDPGSPIPDLFETYHRAIGRALAAIDHFTPDRSQEP
jgi:hypothetical protein